MKTTRIIVAGCVALAGLTGCDWEKVDHDPAVSDSGDGGAETDAGLDGGKDAGVDGGTDAGSGPSTPDAGADAGFDAGSGNIAVFVRGDLTPKTFTDGYAGQTPSVQLFGFSRLELMVNASDPSPVTAFDHRENAAMVDLLSPTPTLAGRASSAMLPTGTYSHGRVLMTLARTTVDASAHVGGLSVPGKLTVTTALSDTTVLGQAWTKGRTTYGFLPNGSTIGQSFEGAAPPLPSGGGSLVVQDANHTWLVFPFSTPFVIDPADTTAQSATIHYEVDHSFRWQDQSLTGYAAGVFDLDPGALSAEAVKNFGATGYRTTNP